MSGDKDTFYYCSCYLCNRVKKNIRRKRRMADIQEIKEQLEE